MPTDASGYGSLDGDNPGATAAWRAREGNAYVDFFVAAPAADEAGEHCSNQALTRFGG